MNDFFKLLRKTRKSFVWYVTKKGKIRGFRLNKSGISYCPITAVCYNETGDTYSQNCVENAISRLWPKLTDCNKYDITEAADTKTLNPKVRQRLLKNLNLD